ncbi:MAG: hypothetical protein MH132_09725 [Hydrotalea sp.]|nr:hypothetical protein [Hydrotalea sp.]
MKGRPFLLQLFLLFFLISGNLGFLYAQPNTSIELTKPKKYEERKLGAEKTADSKMGVVKRVFQNNFTHFNYYYNAQQKIIEIESLSKQLHKDNYTQLLSFYPFTLEETAQQSGLIDSIIYKANAGILLHDLRNDWVDDMYLMMGIGYLYRKDFDSAYQVFSYLQYIYADKDDGYDIPIGSNESRNKGSFSIVGPDQRSFLQKIFRNGIKRPEAVLWMARTFLENNQADAAKGILELLQQDVYFPKKLQPHLHELQAYYYYQTKQADSMWMHMEKAEVRLSSQQEKARWKFLAAQLLQENGEIEKAKLKYQQAARQATDPILMVYANIQQAILDDQIQTSDKYASQILALSKREKYALYRDIMFYEAGVLQQRKNDYKTAVELFRKSLQNDQQHLPRATILFELGKSYFYEGSFSKANFYLDSVDVQQLSINQSKWFKLNKEFLPDLAKWQQEVLTQDSLLQLAALPESQRKAFLLKTLKALRKAKGLQEEPSSNFGGGANNNSNTETGSTLFASGNTAAGSFYFSNNALKSKGFTEFKTKWGGRQNVDNWRRQSAMDMGAPGVVNDQTDNSGNIDDEAEITIEDLEANLPLSEDAKKKTISTKETAKLNISNTLIFAINEPIYAIPLLDSIIANSTTEEHVKKALELLYHAYRKLDNTDAATRVKNELIRLTKTDPDIKTTTGLNEKKELEDTYKNIYQLLIEGKFEEAIEKRKKIPVADSTSIWAPKLLFLEAIYHIRQQNDSLAISALDFISQNYSTSELANNAAIWKDVLQRRKEIEQYLTKLEIQKSEEVEVERMTDVSDKKIATNEKPANQPKTQLNKPTEIQQKQIEVKQNVPMASKEPLKEYQFSASSPHFAVLILEKVDPVFITEARNAMNRYHQTRMSQAGLTTQIQKINDQFSFLLVGPFSQAGMSIDYLDKIQPITAQQILPWLSKDRFSWIIISPENLELLFEKKDMPTYKEFLHKAIPAKF